MFQGVVYKISLGVKSFFQGGKQSFVEDKEYFIGEENNKFGSRCVYIAR